jgi:hypothetical protein
MPVDFVADGFCVVTEFLTELTRKDVSKFATALKPFFEDL